MEALQATDVTLQKNSSSSPMLHPDWVISTNPRKKKKKKTNNSNSLVNDVTLQRNSTGSDKVPSDNDLKKKKKRKRGGKNLNALIDVNFIQQPVDATCLLTDSRLEQCNIQVDDCDNIQKTSFSNLSLSNDSNITGRISGVIVDSRTTLQVKVNQVPVPNANPVSIIGEHKDQVCANNGPKELSLDAPLDKKKRKKKKKNLNTLVSSIIIPSTSVMGDPKSMQHITEQLVSQEMPQNKYETKDRIYSGEDSSGIIDAKVDKISVSQNMGPIHKVAGRDDLACGVETGNMVMVPVQAWKTKRKKKKKNLTMLVSSVIIPSNSVKGAPEVVPTESTEQSIQHSTEQVISQGIQQNEYATKDKNCSGEDSPSIHNAKVDKILVSQDMNPVHEVAGDDYLARGADICGKMVMVPLQAQKIKRKKKKKNLHTLVSSVIMPSTYDMADPELMQHSTEQGVSQGIHQNECETKDKNCNGEDSSGIVDGKVDELSVSPGKAVGNIHKGKKRKRKIRGNNVILEPEEVVISSNDLSEEQHVKRAKLNADQNVGIGRMLPGSVPKKLLVLDLNGLLADVVGDNSVTIKADGHVAGKKIFKRPFCEDFLQFCFNRFTVGVWSSRRKENVDKVLQVLMPEEDRSKLAFVWNQSHCTRTGFQTLENIDKPLFLKELPKLWKIENRKFSFKVVDYDKSNTLLLDDSPYKALLNPPYTAIFPTPYQYQDQNDAGLGHGGDLRVYLEGLALAEDVQEYVEQNPFGQKPIIKSDPSWSFYAEVIRNMSKKRRRKRLRNK
ncbi:uncharacterized protein LOC141717944 isoform X2 [Apium graveolens]|uniref:uncharacterized protein LOC141717944 isoform X2 n=1 Tax=Apium graveolens TaxID=4045 RepID=UPI003D7BAFBD